LQFIVYDNSVGGNEQGPILTNEAVAVNNGLFTTTLDFGPGVVARPGLSEKFKGAWNWLFFKLTSPWPQHRSGVAKTQHRP